VALAKEHAADFAARAAQHDREGSFPHESIRRSNAAESWLPARRLSWVGWVLRHTPWKRISGRRRGRMTVGRARSAR
jgi:hypothetical protein